MRRTKVTDYDRDTAYVFAEGLDVSVSRDTLTIYLPDGYVGPRQHWHYREDGSRYLPRFCFCFRDLMSLPASDHASPWHKFDVTTCESCHASELDDNPTYYLWWERAQRERGVKVLPMY